MWTKAPWPSTQSTVLGGKNWADPEDERSKDGHFAEKRQHCFSPGGPGAASPEAGGQGVTTSQVSFPPF